jgi:hypothetical protein
MPASVSAVSAANVESIVETTFDSPVAWNAGDAGWHGVEKPMEPLGSFSGCACDIAKPSTTRSESPNAKLAHLPTMDRSYIQPPARAIEKCNMPRNAQAVEVLLLTPAFSWPLIDKAKWLRTQFK